MRFFVISTVIVIGLGVWAPVIAQEALDDTQLTNVRLVPSKENVVASELLGEWNADDTIGAKLGGQSDHFGIDSIIFRKNKESEQRIITYLNEMLATALESETDPENRGNLMAMQILYLAGEVEFSGHKRDFALTSVWGTPRLLIYDREGDLESENVMLAKDDEGDNDLLFLGGDLNNQSFGAFERAKEKSISGQ